MLFFGLLKLRVTIKKLNFQLHPVFDCDNICPIHSKCNNIFNSEKIYFDYKTQEIGKFSKKFNFSHECHSVFKNLLMIFSGQCLFREIKLKNYEYFENSKCPHFYSNGRVGLISTNNKYETIYSKTYCKRLNSFYKYKILCGKILTREQGEVACNYFKRNVENKNKNGQSDSVEFFILELQISENPGLEISRIKTYDIRNIKQITNLSVRENTSLEFLISELPIMKVKNIDSSEDDCRSIFISPYFLDLDGYKVILKFHTSEIINKF